MSQNRDKFTEYDSARIQVSGNGSVMCHTRSGFSASTYGQRVCKSNPTDCIHTWKLKVENVHDLIIGIDESSCMNKSNMFHQHAETKNYAYMSSGSTKKTNEGRYTTHGSGYKSGDTVTVRFDTHAWKLKFYTNDKHMVTIPNIDSTKQYRLAIASYVDDEKVTILSYHATRNNDVAPNQVDDVKCSECDSLRDQNQILLSAKNSLQTLVDQLLKQQDTLQNENRLLMQNNTDLTNENNQLVQNVNDIKAEKQGLLKQRQAINDECKEITVQFNELKHKYNALKQKVKLNPLQYTEWTADEMLQWITTWKNGKFNKYKSVLLTAFSEQNFDGSCVQFLEKTDVSEWGINDFKDKSEIYQIFQSLRDGNNKSLNVDEGSSTAYI
eukprot:99516_1